MEKATEGWVESRCGGNGNVNESSYEREVGRAESGKASSRTTPCRGVRYNAKVNGRRRPTHCNGDAVVPRNHARSGSTYDDVSNIAISSVLVQLLALGILCFLAAKVSPSASVQKRNVNM